MRRAGIIFAAIAVVLIGAYVALVAAKTLEPPAVSISSTAIEYPAAKNVTLAWPKQGNASIGTLDGGLYETSGSVVAKPTASMAKTITVLVVLDKFPLSPDESGPIITMGVNDLNLYKQTVADGGTNLAISPGEQITERQMIDGIMLVSANNLADSLAIWAFGSLDNYRVAAEIWLAKNGLSDTHIGSDASGLDPATTSSTKDLFAVGVLAMKNDTLRQVVAQQTAQFPGVGEVKNTDTLLGTDGFVGIKTGYTSEAGGCYLFASGDDDTDATFVGVVTAQADLATRFDVAKTLVDSAKINFSQRTLLQTDQVVGEITTPWGSGSDIITKSALIESSWNDQISTPNITFSQDLRPPIAAGTIVGTAKISDKTVDLVTQTAIEKPSIWWTATHVFAK